MRQKNNIGYGSLAQKRGQKHNELAHFCCNAFLTYLTNFGCYTNSVNLLFRCFLLMLLHSSFSLFPVLLHCGCRTEEKWFSPKDCTKTSIRARPYCPYNLTQNHLMVQTRKLCPWLPQSDTQNAVQRLGKDVAVLYEQTGLSMGETKHSNCVLWEQQSQEEIGTCTLPGGHSVAGHVKCSPLFLSHKQLQML